MMTQAMRSGSQQRWGAMALVVSLLLAFMWLSPTAKAEGAGWVGKVETMPAGGGSGPTNRMRNPETLIRPAAR